MQTKTDTYFWSRILFVEKYMRSNVERRHELLLLLLLCDGIHYTTNVPALKAACILCFCVCMSVCVRTVCATLCLMETAYVHHCKRTHLHRLLPEMAMTIYGKLFFDTVALVMKSGDYPYMQETQDKIV